MKVFKSPKWGLGSYLKSTPVKMTLNTNYVHFHTRMPAYSHSRVSKGARNGCRQPFFLPGILSHVIMINSSPIVPIIF